MQFAGYKFPVSKRSLKDVNTLLYIPKVDPDKPCYIRVEGSGMITGLGFTIMKIEEAISEINYLGYLSGLFYGILIIVIIYAITLSFMMKDLIYMVYAIYVLAFGIYYSVVWGHWVLVMNYFDWEFSYYFYTIPYVFMILSLIYYCKLILSIPKLNWLFNSLIGVRLFILLAGYLFGNEVIDFNNNLIDSFLLLIVFIVALYQKYKKQHVSNYFIISFVLIFIGVINNSIFTKIFPTYPVNTHEYIQAFFSYFSVSNLGILEIFFFALALAKRMQLMKMEKEQLLTDKIEQLKRNEELKDRINIELERKVEERTKLIQDQAKEIERINAELLKYNRNLETQIESVTIARVEQKKLSYEEFLLVYPDNDYCKQFLFDLKWGNGYKCRKCSREKYRVLNKYDTQCSNCSHIESSSADTIFHNIKFPLNKAFYILICISSMADSRTIEEISREIDLRTATVWSFKQKILDKIAEKKIRRRDSEIWKKLIL